MDRNKASEYAQKEFVAVVSQVSSDSHSINRANGFWDAVSDAQNDRQELALANERLMLIVSEAAEAMEALRVAGFNAMDDKLPEFRAVSVELADVIIRALDFAEGFELHTPLGMNEVVAAVEKKIALNKTRPRMHGGKLF